MEVEEEKEMTSESEVEIKKITLYIVGFHRTDVDDHGRNIWKFHKRHFLNKQNATKYCELINEAYRELNIFEYLAEVYEMELTE